MTRTLLGSLCVSTLAAMMVNVIMAESDQGHRVDIQVGMNGPRFTPEQVTAMVGDILLFHFHPGVHSVSESRFDQPCHPVKNAISSGDIYVLGQEVSSEVFEVKINNTDPIWLYCSNGQQCPQGMAMVINPPRYPLDQTLENYKLLAQSAEPASPWRVLGGILVNKQGASSTSMGYLDGLTAHRTHDTCSEHGVSQRQSGSHNESTCCTVTETVYRYVPATSTATGSEPSPNGTTPQLSPQSTRTGEPQQITKEVEVTMTSTGGEARVDVSSSSSASISLFTGAANSMEICDARWTGILAAGVVAGLAIA